MNQTITAIEENIAKVMIGKGETVDLLLTALISGGHVLLEDVPGMGKTVLAKALAKSMDMQFGRIQFTPDLLPSDVTGLSYYNREQGRFVFREGPVFTNLLLADEINRATPRTQSSLLECMGEGQVTVDGDTRNLANPFFVIATQNPVETLGCFPLPEAQMDRFMMRMSLGYMTRSEEIGVALRTDSAELLDSIDVVVSVEETEALRRRLSDIEISEPVMGYLMDIIEATRQDQRINIGASPRGTIALCKAARAYAAFSGRNYVIPEDVKKLAPYVIVHRLHFRNAAASREAAAIFDSILSGVTVPKEDSGSVK